MSTPQPRLVADRYRLLEPLGQGGMGRVWKARDEVLHRDVAIKELVPPPGLTDDERREMRERSLREARAIARLNHVNVVRVFDVLRTDGDPWIVMEYVPSRSLHDVLTKDGPVPVDRGIDIGLGVLGALKAAHRAGVMHRDVKPGNVLLGEDGRVVLTDFGLATVPGDPNVTRTGLVLGSPAYIAPERAKDGTAGPRSDLWSLGATLYAAVEGQSPFARSSAIATLAALATEPVPPPRNAGPLKGVLAGLLRKDPEQRMTAEEAEKQLRRLVHRRHRGGMSLFEGVRRAPQRPAALPGQRSGPSGPTPTGGTGAARGAAAVGGALAGAAAGGAAASGPAIAGPAASAPVTEQEKPFRDADQDGVADATASGGAPSAPAEADAAPDTATAEGAAEPDVAEAEAPAETGDVDAAAPTSPSGTGESGTARADDGTEAGALAGGAVAGGAVAAGAADGPAAASGAAARPGPAFVPGQARLGNAPTPTDGTRVDGVPALGRAPITVPPPAPARSLPGSRRSWLIGALLLATVLLAVFVAVPLAREAGKDDGGGDPKADNTSSPSSPSAVPAPPAGTEPAGTPAPAPSAAQSSASSPSTASPNPPRPLPAGWKWHNDPTGFKVPVLIGWTMRREKTGPAADDVRVYFDDPNSRRMLLIDQTRDPQPDPVADWTSQEPYRKSRYADYRRVKIEAVDYWKVAADWEWTMTQSGVTMHVRNRGFVTAKDQAYAIRWDTPEADWRENLRNFAIIADGFVPARRD